ncbi:hypothetical protein ON05_026535 [Acaryochloris sp. CCMEE 5410]|nr:hypothetical protein [Acaryochloris sp. CCMEE 5410]KAI9131211.1 hypothetical protein ON05_026535 [Acaryochloris sp. CCMEE 5410]
MGDIDQFIPLLQLEARKQDFESAPSVIWLSDGGEASGESTAPCSLTVLWQFSIFSCSRPSCTSNKVMFGDVRSAQAQAWFRRWRHQLRHGQHLLVLRSLTMLIHSQLFTGKSFTTLLQVQAYFQRHLRHIQYRHFEQLQIPLGSGMVESACKWLIQQRFKGVGMRWSEDGFNHLLMLRLAWVNQRFDSLFPGVTIPKSKASPIH